MQISDMFTFTLNLTSIVLALGIEIAGVLVYRGFRGGWFAKPFLALLAAPFFFLLAGLCDLIGNIVVSANVNEGVFFYHLHDVFQLLFILAILVTMALMYRYWMKFAKQ